MSIRKRFETRTPPHETKSFFPVQHNLHDIYRNVQIPQQKKKLIKVEAQMAVACEF